MAINYYELVVHDAPAGVRTSHDSDAGLAQGGQRSLVGVFSVGDHTHTHSILVCTDESCCHRLQVQSVGGHVDADLSLIDHGCQLLVKAAGVIAVIIRVAGTGEVDSDPIATHRFRDGPGTETGTGGLADGYNDQEVDE